MKRIILLMILFTLIISSISVADEENRKNYVSGELIIKVRDNSKINNIATDIGADSFKYILKNNGILKDLSNKLFLVYVDENTDLVELSNKLNKRSDIEYAEPNYILEAQLIPNDVFFNNQWALHNIEQTNGVIDSDIDAPEAWDISTETPIIVAVIDTGVDYNHQDLASNIWTNVGEIPDNGLDDDNNGYVDDVRGWDFRNDDNDPIDDNNHGTHCAGIIGAVGNNGIGTSGVNWDVKIMPLKFLDSSGSGPTSEAILAIQYATMMGAKVTSNSWGGGFFLQSLYDAIESANEAGVLFIAAAGNSGRDNDVYQFYPSNYNNTNLISVAASNDEDFLASFSNYGITTVDLAAPGDYIYSTIRNDAYSYLSGTSMATPYVAGAAALLMGIYPEKSHLQIKETLLNTVDKPYSLQGKVLSGGRLNINNAINNIIKQPQQAPILETTIQINDTNLSINDMFKITTTTTCISPEGAACGRIYVDPRFNEQLIYTKIKAPMYILSRSSYGLFTCYQESANVAVTCVFSLDQAPGTGTYEFNGNWVHQTYLNDKSFNTYASDNTTDSETSYMYVTYVKPNKAISSGLWLLKDGINNSGPIYQKIPISCWNYNVDKLFKRVSELNGFVSWECLNASGWQIIRSGIGHPYEEGEYWHIGETYIDSLKAGQTFSSWYIIKPVLSGIYNIDALYLSVLGEINTEDITISVGSTTENLPPISNAGTDITLSDSNNDGFEVITLDGSGSYDQDGVITAYEWFENSSLIAVGVNPSILFDVGIHTVSLKVIDNVGDSDTDDVVIMVGGRNNITLSVDVQKVLRKYVAKLAWIGALGETVDIYKNGLFLITTENDGYYEDSFTSWNKKKPLIYSVCDNYICSNEVITILSR